MISASSLKGTDNLIRETQNNEMTVCRVKAERGDPQCGQTKSGQTSWRRWASQGPGRITSSEQGWKHFLTGKPRSGVMERKSVRGCWPDQGTGWYTRRKAGWNWSASRCSTKEHAVTCAEDGVIFLHRNENAFWSVHALPSWPLWTLKFADILRHLLETAEDTRPEDFGDTVAVITSDGAAGAQLCEVGQRPGKARSAAALKGCHPHCAAGGSWGWLVLSHSCQTIKTSSVWIQWYIFSYINLLLEFHSVFTGGFRLEVTLS